ncbi:MAG TPA: MFS transporter [Candidatus Methylacidiphilales bacterium]
MSALEPPTFRPAAAVKGKTWSVGSLIYDERGLRFLFAWLLWGDFAWSIRDRTVIPVLQMVLKSQEVSDTLAGILMGTLPAALGFVLGPVAATWSDRHRGRRGRRIPFLLASAPAAAAAIVGLGLSPWIGGWLHHALGPSSPGAGACVVVAIALCWAFFDVATTMTNGLFGALINDVVPSSVMGRFYGLFRAVSLVVGIVFNFWLLGKAEAHFTPLFIGVGAIYGIGVVSMCLKVREGSYPPPEAIEGSGAGRWFRSASLFFRHGFSRPYYLWFFFGCAFGGLATVPVNLYQVFFAKSLGMSMETFGAYSAGMFAVSLGLAYFIGSLADRFHPLPLTIAVLLLYGVVGVIGFAFIRDSLTFGIALLVNGVVAGTFYTVSGSLGQRILPRASFAQIGAAGGLISGVFNIVAPVLIGGALDLRGHDYRWTFLMGGVLAFFAAGCLAVVYRGWLRYGGAEHYAAPE